MSQICSRLQRIEERNFSLTVANINLIERVKTVERVNSRLEKKNCHLGNVNSRLDDDVKYMKREINKLTLRQSLADMLCYLMNLLPLCSNEVDSIDMSANTLYE